MKMRKEAWYVLAFVLVILLIIFVFGDEINFSPGARSAEKSQSEIIRTNWIENINKLGVVEQGYSPEAFFTNLNNALRRTGLIV